MIREIKLPEVAENVEKGTVIKVLVSKGDMIEKDQAVIEMETEKAALEVPSPEKGKVAEVLVSEGETVNVGQVILKLEIGEVAEEKTEETGETARQESTEEVTTAVEEEAEDAEKPSESREKTEPAALKKEMTADEKKDVPKISAPASPSVRRLARELGIDIGHVPGSGPGGRISIEDVKDFTKKTIVSGKEAVRDISPEQALPDFSQWGTIEKAPMSGIRKATARNVGYAWNVVPHVTQDDKADITEVEEFRKNYAAIVEKAGGKLTVTAILMKVICAALKAFPQFNASIDVANGDIIYKKYYNIGIAVDTERGLLVPVVKDVDKKNITQLSLELNEIAEKARNKKIGPDELRGGNFTISNLGGIGGTHFTPIVYAPQVAILGVSRSRVEPVYMDGEFVPRLMLPLSLSYDHRIIDGADGIRFLRWIIGALEQPLLLSLEG